MRRQNVSKRICSKTGTDKYDWSSDHKCGQECRDLTFERGNKVNATVLHEIQAK